MLKKCTCNTVELRTLPCKRIAWFHIRRFLSSIRLEVRKVLLSKKIACESLGERVKKTFQLNPANQRFQLKFGALKNKINKYNSLHA